MAAGKHVLPREAGGHRRPRRAADREDGHERRGQGQHGRGLPGPLSPSRTRRWCGASTPAPSATSSARRPTTTRKTSSGRPRPACRRSRARLRNWVFDRVLSGDILVEQNIHVIDIVNWVMRGPPGPRRGHGRQEGAAGRRQLGPLQRELHLPGQRPRQLQLHAVQEQLRRQDPALLRDEGLRGGQLRQGRRAHRRRGALGRRARRRASKRVGAAQDRRLPGEHPHARTS